MTHTGPEDRASAMAMITEAAVTYDKTSPAAVSLDAFEGATMSPLVFREQLRRYGYCLILRSYPWRRIPEQGELPSSIPLLLFVCLPPNNAQLTV